MQPSTSTPADYPAVLPFHGPSHRPDHAAAVRGRVLHLINGEHYSGAERVQDLLGLNLPDLGYEVGFACVKPGLFPATRQARDIPLYRTRMYSRVDLHIVGRLCDIVREKHYNMLHAHTPRTALLGTIVAWRTRLPLVYHVHSPTCRDSTRKWHNLVNSWIESLSIRRAQRTITVSHSLAEWMMAQGVPRERLDVVPNGVPAPATRRSPTPPQSPWNLGTVALFRPRKGLEVLLQAMSVVQNAGYPVRLRAVGSFETREYELVIRQLVNDLKLHDAIDWIGFTEDVPGELARMDLFVLPSLFGEGLPMVVLEAMASGLPVVGTLVEGVPEAVRANVDGVLVPPRDPQALANGIQEVISGALDWSSLRRHAVQRHADHFSDQAMARGVAQIYDHVIAESSS